LSLCREGVLGEWRYSSTHSLTSALDGVEWSISHIISHIIICECFKVYGNNTDKRK